MATVAPAGFEWNKSAPVPPASDGAPAAFSERPIRPLPKRRLRSRLSDQQAEEIGQTPILSSSSPSFAPAAPANDKSASLNFTGAAAFTFDISKGLDHATRANGAHDFGDYGSEEDLVDDLDQRQRKSWRKMSQQPRRSFSPSRNASESFEDDYDGFGFDKNKKKRKVPGQSGGLSGFDDVNSEAAQFTEAGWYHERDGGVGQYYGSGAMATPSSGVGVSGAGRGRNKVNTKGLRERGPLTQSTHAVNASVHGQVSNQHTGLIGSAMAEAQAKANAETRRGQENYNVARQGSSGAPNDFTFACNSLSGEKLSQVPQMNAPGAPGTTPHAASGPMRGPGGPQPQSATNPAVPPNGQPNPAASLGHEQPLSQNAPAPPPPSDSAKYVAADRQRRRQQRSENIRNPPKPQDIWICEFCEYELIFERKPMALIRSYEEKDYKRRQEAENRRRLLEKAKAKGRKNKKNKGNGKNSAAPNPSQDPSQQPYDPQYDDLPPHDPQSPGDEFYDDEYDDAAAALSNAAEYGDEMYEEDYLASPIPPVPGPPPAPNAANNYNAGLSTGRKPKA